MASTRTQNAIVGGLVVLAVGASAYAFWSVGQPHPSSLDSAVATGTVTPTDDAATSSTQPDGKKSEDSRATSTEAPPTTAPAADGSPAPTAEDWQEAWSEDADLLVIGDGYSNLPSQWVQQWADRVGEDRPVKIRHWGEASDVEFNDPIVLSEEGGPSLTVWSAGRAGSTVQAAAERYDRFVDASTTPDAVLVTLGLSSADEDIAEGLDALVRQIAEDAPVLVLVGPEGLYEEGVSDAFATWAQDNDERVALLDLRDVAPENPTAEQWAVAFEDALDEA